MSMKLYVDVETSLGKSGVTVRSESLGLAGFGENGALANESLTRAVLTWCESLQRLGRLDRVVRQRRLRWEEAPELSVELVPEVD